MRVRITESDINRMVRRSVNMIKESLIDDHNQKISDIRERMFEMAQSDPKTFAEVVNMFVNEQGNNAWEDFSEIMRLFNGGMDYSDSDDDLIEGKDRDAEEKANDIIEQIQERGFNFGGMSKDEFIKGVMSNWGVSKSIARLVAKKTGNW